VTVRRVARAAGRSSADGLFAGGCSRSAVRACLLVAALAGGVPAQVQAQQPEPLSLGTSAGPPPVSPPPGRSQSAPVVAPDPFSAAGPNRLNGQITGQVALAAGEFQAITLTGRPEVYFVSGNGRFVIRGSLYDMWQGKELPALDDIQLAAQSVNFLALAQLMPQFAPLRFGSGLKQIAVFVDPFSPYRQRLLADIAARGDDGVHQFVILPVALPGPDSVRAVTSLQCAADQDAALQALLSHDRSALLQGSQTCDVGPVQKRLIFARLLQIHAVPFLIRDDGVRQEGMPPNLGVWLAGARG
jgi:thiol:disulfide interchange protein DsbC